MYLDWQPNNHSKARHDGRELKGACLALLAACDESNSPRVLLPIKLAATIEAMSCAPDATPREIGRAAFMLEQDAAKRARAAGIDQILFLGSNPATTRAAMDYAGYSLLVSPVLRKLLCE